MENLPKHIGFIVDGNRRWATSQSLPAYEGHRAGYKTLKDILLETIHRGVPYVSAYVFSTENWKRSEEEVGWLMNLLLTVLKKDAHIFIDNNIRLRVIGGREKLSRKIVAAIEEVEKNTAHLTAGTVVLCLNYGGQQEVADAVKELIEADTASRDVTPELISQHLYAPDIPPCDLVVRTSGEQRLSNFMLWRSAYSEFIFIDKPWPDMTNDDITAILKEYSSRKRRFGG
jgi:undecaprenyl diphosphate synthase